MSDAVVLQRSRAAVTVSRSGAPTVQFESAPEIHIPRSNLPGPPGPPGPPGGVVPPFIQAIPANIWTITHNLGRSPIVTIYDQSNQQVLAHVEEISPTQVRITFGGAMAGRAILA